MIAGISVSEPATFAALRHHFQAQPELQIIPIEKIRLPLKSRDELPPLLAGRQWDLWQILVLGVVRLGLDADWDRLEHIANDDTLVRQMLGLPAAPWDDQAKMFGHQTLRDNVALLDEELLQQLNARIAAAGSEGFAKKGGAPVAALAVKVDPYVLETDVHFPADLNLLWDAGRKCVDKACLDPMRFARSAVGAGRACLAQSQAMAAATQGVRTARQPERLSRRSEPGSAEETGRA
jgi:hypothetical protein